jgi:aminoglycoside 3-N-acetyltransferase
MNTRATVRAVLVAMLRELGLGEGMTVLVHASLRAMGLDFVHGAACLHEALMEVLGATGTVVVPTQTAWNSTTSPVHVQATAGMSAEDKRTYLASLEAFDPDKTPSYGMGAYAEYVRLLDSSVRSTHPQTSFAAVGRRAARLAAVHSLECHLGPQSPLGALYRQGAKTALLGVGYDSCTAFHYGEYLWGGRPVREYECRLAGAPGDGWTSFRDIELDAGEFLRLGADFERTGAVCAVLAGAYAPARATVFEVRAAAQFAGAWLAAPRAG